MTERRYFLPANRGFSAVGTLLALFFGAIIAALVVSLIQDMIRGRRTLFERDEMSEFALFVKNVLTTDATCSAVLLDTPFKADGKVNLELAVGYGQQADAVIQKGFVFADGDFKVEEISLEDRSEKTAQFKIGVPEKGEGLREVKVRRHLARIKLQIANAADGTTYRPRYFEIPVLVNTESHKVQMCNNQINVGDACQALGFRWDTTSGPGACVATSACVYGGAYTSTSAGGCVANPATGACTCPDGYTPVLSGSVNIQRLICAKGCDSFQYDAVYQCFRCPQ